MVNANPVDASAVATIHLMILVSMADTDAAVARWGMADTDAAVARCGMVAAMALTSVLSSAMDAVVASFTSATDAAVARCGMVAAMALTSVLSSAMDAVVASFTSATDAAVARRGMAAAITPTCVFRSPTDSSTLPNRFKISSTLPPSPPELIDEFEIPLG